VDNVGPDNIPPPSDIFPSSMVSWVLSCVSAAVPDTSTLAASTSSSVISRRLQSHAKN
jgi:hypothetical protein